jgi:CelD/BcsL family acetyltransferase involved in cellulose biosynthesis
VNSIRFYGWDEAVREVGDAWRQIVCERAYNPSLGPDWLGATLAAWRLCSAARVAVVTHDENRLTILPFLVRRQSLLGLPLRAVDLCSNVFSYHAEIISSGDVASALSLVLSDRSFPPWDAFRLSNVPVDGATAASVRRLDRAAACGVSTRAAEASPFLRISGTWQEYLATRPKKVRANISRSQRLMREAGESALEWYEDGSDWRRLLAAILEIEASSWKADAGVAIVAGSPQCDYYERLLPWLASDGLMANVLYVRQKPVAYTLCAARRGWVGQLKTSYVEGLGDAGSRVIHCSLERAFERRQTEYDFLGDVAPHKMRWAHDVRRHEDLWLFRPNVKGQFLRRLKALADAWHALRRPLPETSAQPDAR